ncbi:hypothetical protein EPN28_00895 [Patescibacteria group bacterium]|nr:MAG: hypothetical protein EPN28_00895 [Patescibacteria group bacterium]
MHQPHYTEALAKAWHLVWRHKVLWIFGLAATFLGQFGLSDFFGQLYLFLRGGQAVNLWWLDFFTADWPAGWQSIVGLTWAVGILLLILLAAACLTACAQGAAAAYALEWYKKGRADATKAWRRGVNHFWRVLGINFLRKILATALMALFLYYLSFVLESEAGWAVNFGVLLVLGLLFFVYVAVYAVSIYAIGYAVATNVKMPEALAKGAKMFWEHVLVSLEVGVILVVLNLLFVGAVFMSFFLAFTPSLILWLLAGFLGPSALLVTGGLAVGVFFWMIFAALCAGVFNAYNISIWMHLFVKMHHVGIPSRIVRFLHWIARRA